MKQRILCTKERHFKMKNFPRLVVLIIHDRCNMSFEITWKVPLKVLRADLLRERGISQLNTRSYGARLLNMQSAVVTDIRTSHTVPFWHRNTNTYLTQWQSDLRRGTAC